MCSERGEGGIFISIGAGLGAKQSSNHIFTLSTFHGRAHYHPCAALIYRERRAPEAVGAIGTGTAFHAWLIAFSLVFGLGRRVG